MKGLSPVMKKVGCDSEQASGLTVYYVVFTVSNNEINWPQYEPPV